MEKLEENYSEKEIKRIIGNATSAYLFMAFFLLFSKDKYVANDFVSSHIKSALFVHVALIVNYILFISYKLGAHIMPFGISLNTLLASSISIFLLLILIGGIYRANSKQTLNIGKNLKVINKKNLKLLDITGNNVFDERDKVTILLSYIPFFGYFLFGKYYKNIIIQNTTKFNLISTLIILSLYISGSYNLANLLSLFYIIFVVFTGIHLFSRSNLIHINIDKIPSFERMQTLCITFMRYLKNYFSKDTLIDFKIKEQEIQSQRLQTEIENEKLLQLYEKRRFPRWLIYIPFINLLSIFFIKNIHRFHMINGLIITLILTISIALYILFPFNANIIWLIIIPICYGTGYIAHRKAYQMPFIYFLYQIYSHIFQKTKNINKKYNINKEVKLTVKK